MSRAETWELRCGLCAKVFLFSGRRPKDKPACQCRKSGKVGIGLSTSRCPSGAAFVVGEQVESREKIRGITTE